MAVICTLHTTVPGLVKPRITQTQADRDSKQVRCETAFTRTDTDRCALLAGRCAFGACVSRVVIEESGRAGREALEVEVVRVGGGEGARRAVGGGEGARAAEGGACYALTVRLDQSGRYAVDITPAVVQNVAIRALAACHQCVVTSALQAIGWTSLARFGQRIGVSD